MSTATLGAVRAGIAACICPPAVHAAGVGAPRRIGLLSVGAAASVFSQTLMFGLLPLVGAAYAPEAGLGPVPFVALLVGAVAATFPAAILTDVFGRRAALALGASLGVAGGTVLAWGLLAAAFWPIVLGAFWIGIANGFALHYRHAAVAGLPVREAARSIAIVVGVGAAVGFVAPALAAFFETALEPALGAGTALLAAGAHVVALAAALGLPAPAGSAAPLSAAPPVRSRFLAAMAIGAGAWFGMMATMVHAPLGLAACGIGLAGTVGAIAWHVVAMYAPALALGPLVGRFGTLPVAAAGLALVATGLVLSASFATVAAIATALILSGAGWALATGAGVVALHEGRPSRLAVAGHDAAILAAAVAGAFASLAL